MHLDIVMAGVGGQGTVLAARILATAAMKAGFEVRSSEMIGMAQREGSVASHVRLAKGENLYGGIVPEAKADFLLGFELAEGIRNLKKLAPAGKALINSSAVIPPAVYAGQTAYEVENLRHFLKEEVPQTYLFDAGLLASEAGNPRTVSMVMLGALSAFEDFPFEPELILATARELLPPKLHDVNEKAWELGRQQLATNF